MVAQHEGSTPEAPKNNRTIGWLIVCFRLRAEGVPVVSSFQDLANLLDELQVKFTLSQGSSSCQEDEVALDPNPQYSKMPLPAAA